MNTPVPHYLLEKVDVHPNVSFSKMQLQDDDLAITPEILRTIGSPSVGLPPGLVDSLRKDAIIAALEAEQRALFPESKRTFSERTLAIITPIENLPEEERSITIDVQWRAYAVLGRQELPSGMDEIDAKRLLKKEFSNIFGVRVRKILGQTEQEFQAIIMDSVILKPSKILSHKNEQFIDFTPIRTWIQYNLKPKLFSLKESLVSLMKNTYENVSHPENHSVLNSVSTQREQ